MLVLDTHTLIWLDEGSRRLGKAALLAINKALASGKLGISAISLWEITMLLQKKRLAMIMEPDVWFTELLQAGLLDLQMSGRIAIRAGQLESFHGDPADRIIVATALEYGGNLVTADEKILAWDKQKMTIDARQ